MMMYGSLSGSRWRRVARVLGHGLGWGAAFLGLFLAPSLGPSRGPSLGPALAAAQSAARAPFKLESGRLVMPSPVVFETGSDKLKSESTPALEYAKAFLDEKTYITLLRIESHTDANGAPAATLELSVRRAVAVGRWLVSHGIDCKRVLPVGFGGTKPIVDNATPEGREQNRRTVFVAAALRERPIGGMPVDGGGVIAPANLCAK